MEIIIINTFEIVKHCYTHMKFGYITKNEFWDGIINPVCKEIKKSERFSTKKLEDYIYSGIVGNEFEKLDEQLSALFEIDLLHLQLKFTEITGKFPYPSIKKMYVVIYPFIPFRIENKTEYICNGYSFFPNIIILTISPFEEYWQEQIVSLFAHEYYHNIWDHNKYMKDKKWNHKNISVLDRIITEGEAQLFEEFLFPDFFKKYYYPKRKYNDDKSKYWEKIKPILHSTCPLLYTLYFGGFLGLSLYMDFFPLDIIYSLGYEIVRGYMEKYPNVTFPELLNIDNMNIIESSKYHM